MQKQWLKLSILIAVLAVSGCASVPLASTAADAAAKKFAVKPGLVNIYIYRTEKLGAAIAMPVLFDGVLVGETAKKTYIVEQVHPGRHTIVSRAENESTLDVFAVAGQNYFVWQEIKMGALKARSELQLVEDAQGKAGVKKCKLIE
jgi:hypothetical protein